LRQTAADCGNFRVKEERITLWLDRELRAFIEAQAEREHRSLTGQVYHLVADAARQQQQERAA
jgi:hypothetical protein